MKIASHASTLFLVLCVSVVQAQKLAPEKEASPATSILSTADSGPLLADVKPAPYRGSITVNLNLGHGRFDMKNASVLDLVAWAYDKYDYAVLSGPTWIDLDRFDVAMKVDTPAPRPAAPSLDGAPIAYVSPYIAVKPVLQRALVERFHLKYHTEERPMPGYIAVIAKDGLKMEPAKDPDAPPYCHGEMAKTSPGVFTTTCTSFTVTQLLKNYGGIFPHLLVDRTGLTKSYDFTSHISFAELRTRDDYIHGYIDMFKQLGIVITEGDVPQAAIVVDSVERPAPTPPEIAAQIPPLPQLEFDVATIKPAADTEPQNATMQRGSQMTFSNFNMQGLLTRAFQLKTGVTLGESLNTLPRERYTILVKLPPEVDARTAFSDADQVDAMLLKLLVDRFGLKYHWSTETRSGYILLPGTPKMKKADVNSRSFCKHGPPPGEKDLRTAPDSPYDEESYCQNVTMDQFADMVEALAGVYVKERVPNKTGLAGSYDFTLYFTGQRKLRSDVAAADAAAKEAGSSSADPVGGLSVEDAIRKELGLQLTKQPGIYPTLIVDHINREPTDN